MAEFWDILDENRNKTGRLHERGKPMAVGEYHLIVHVWIMNSKKEFLISKRTPNKPYPNMWECTGGSAVAGDDSLTTALKEVSEELGIALNPENGHLFKSYIRAHENESYDFADVWFFRQDVQLSEIVFQPDETCDAMWASADKIREMIRSGEFLKEHHYPYFEEMVTEFYFQHK
jgi:8-oxo-dGTP pyrophosphatase MutT (NUDIX family)